MTSPFVLSVRVLGGPKPVAMPDGSEMAMGQRLGDLRSELASSGGTIEDPLGTPHTVDLDPFADLADDTYIALTFEAPKEAAPSPPA